MATTEDRLVIRQLEAARDHLLARGDADAVKSLDAIIGRLEEPDPDPEQVPETAAVLAPVEKDLLTEWEAADVLGIRSTDKVWQWVEQGKLKFRLDNNHPRITRSSIESFLGDPAVEEQRTFEREFAEALAPFEGDEEGVAELLEWYSNGRRWPDGE
jgi:hypothetical protein